MTRVVASDLDRTLIWSAAAGGNVSGAVCVEEYDGAPLSYVSPAAAADLALLVSAGLVVPVTTRTVVQYQRVRLPGGPASFAVCANGGRVLVDGVEDEAHRGEVRAAVVLSATLEEVMAVFGSWCLASTVAGAGHFAPRLRDAEGLFCYAVFPDGAPGGDEVAELVGTLEPLGWRVSVQGRKVYCVPFRLSKEAALEYLAASHGLEVVGSAGDSLLDAGMLRAHPVGWMPRDSELLRNGWSAPGVSITAGSGLDAGEEIVRGFRDLLGV
ncbi:HAD family hydrolase [Nocardioides sp. Kera G14]|uniref:HAD family hydrolase n=1 Tax=Nocardioides sp. Kera G14 TaxID=2884264 RepID=UPI001D11740D|nr:HAD family hydrolase [Nocardioides sp. Kera G14]UDY23233.1 HAD family hydrolase [Nocardioides sp. Kera G14]